MMAAARLLVRLDHAQERSASIRWRQPDSRAACPNKLRRVGGTGAADRVDTAQGSGGNGAENRCVADWLKNTIRMVTPGGDVTTLAGTTGVVVDGAVNGTGAAARFLQPFGLAVDGAGTFARADAHGPCR